MNDMKTKHLIFTIIVVVSLGLFTTKVNSYDENLPSTELFYEEPLEIEPWMLHPFVKEDTVYEDPVELEAWMCELFEITNVT